MKESYKSINKHRRHKKSRKIKRKRRNSKLSFLKTTYGISAGVFSLGVVGSSILFVENELAISFMTMLDYILLACADIWRSADARHISPEIGNLNSESIDKLETRLTKIRTVEKIETSALTGLALTGIYSIISEDVPADKKTIVGLGYLLLTVLSACRLYSTTNDYKQVEAEYKRRVRSINR